MHSCHASPSLPFLILGGVLVGASSGFVASVVSGTFEPYDSGVGLLSNQIILSVPAAVLAWRHRITVPLLFLVSAYPGLNAYVWAFGSSEARAWAGLGALVSMLLFPVPVAFALGAAALRRLRRAPSAVEVSDPRTKDE